MVNNVMNYGPGDRITKLVCMQSYKVTALNLAQLDGGLHLQQHFIPEGHNF